MSERVALKIEGMTCGSCSKAVTARLSKFDFTSNVNVDWEAGSGEFDIDGDFEANKETAINAINQIGYKVVN